MRRALPFVIVLIALLIPVVPTTAEAQRRRRPHRERPEAWNEPGYRNLSLMVGALDTDFTGDDSFPMAAMRADWRLGRFVRTEIDATYALGEVTRTVGGAPRDFDTRVFTSTLGVQAELPLPVVRPYVGAAAGLFGRFDDEDAPSAERFTRVTHAFPVGVRVLISPRLALRGEVRWRFDADPRGSTVQNAEQTAGLSFTY